MKTIVALLLFPTLVLSATAYSQTETSTTIVTTQTTSSSVQFHKDSLQLTLFIDKIVVGKKILTPKIQITIPMTYESDYVKITDELSIKIFISRHQEYGKKFYAWKWDYLRKRGDRLVSEGQSQYEAINFNEPLTQLGAFAHGIGVEGTPDYLMYYYRYKLD